MARFATEGKQVSTATPEEGDKFVVRCDREALVLIDYPPRKPGSDTALKVVREQEGIHPGDDDFSVATMESATMWSALRQQMPMSLAKVRVFCHPDFRDLLRVTVDRGTFESLVNDAINEVAD